MTNREENIDLSKLSYDEWISYIFDHPVPLLELGYSSSICEFDSAAKPEQVVKYVTQLCNQFIDITEKYSQARINKGLWFILGVDMCFGEYLRQESIPQELRKTCVHSMYKVFADFVSKSDIEEMENCFYMWWDLLLSSFYYYDKLELSEDCKEIEDTILATLKNILLLVDERTQQYALHGLGHLKHIEARKVVEDYINREGHNWTDEGRAWAQECKDGTVM